MIYLLASIILNSLLGVIFRYMGTYKINNAAAIVVNYLVCFVVGIIMTGGAVLDVNQLQQEWVPVLLLLGTLFIVTFNAVAATVQTFGITVAALVQKMSVVLVVIFSLLYFREEMNLIRGIGLLAGFISIFLITGRPGKNTSLSKPWIYILLPVIVFLLAGVIDSTFVYVNRMVPTLDQEEIFASYLFFTAGVLGGITLLYSMWAGKRYTWRDVWAGVILGVPNFFSVFFIQKMLTTNMDGSVIYPIHNIGILLLSALLSKLLFQEKFEWMKYVGILLAIGSIILLAFG